MNINNGIDHDSQVFNNNDGSIIIIDNDMMGTFAGVSSPNPMSTGTNHSN